MKKAFALIILITISLTGIAQACFTIGTADDETTNSGDWINDSNWSGTSPGCNINTADQTVEVDVDMTVQDTNCPTLELSGQDAALQVVNSSTLTVEGDFESSAEGACIYIASGTTLIIEGDFIISGESVDLRIDGSMQVLGDLIISNQSAVLDVDGSLEIGGELNCSDPCQAGSTSFPGSGTINALGGCSGEFGTEWDDALPVELVYFRGRANQHGILLDWLTASELNNDYFEIQLSTDGEAYDPIGTVAGQGTSLEITRYEWNYRSPYSGINYFRLKQVDYNGTYSFSKIIGVLNTNSHLLSFSAYPQPASSSLTIEIHSSNHESYIEAVLYEPKGQQVKTFELSKDTREIKFNTAELRNGIYLLRLNQSDQYYVSKLLIHK